jgi:16S rRNA processing protein RimM
MGCQVFDLGRGDAIFVGEVVDVDRETASTDLLVLHGSGGEEELLIPFAKAYLRRVDVEQKRIEMSLPEGLLTINAPHPKDTE